MWIDAAKEKKKESATRNATVADSRNYHYYKGPEVLIDMLAIISDVNSQQCCMQNLACINNIAKPLEHLCSHTVWRHVAEREDKVVQANSR